MSASQPEPIAPPRPQRLAIVHFLGWALGVAVVLTIYRVGAAWRAEGNQTPISLGWWQLGYGLGYGTALAGLGLFLWRWWSGAGSGPTQPGHWLLVFGGLGLLIDVVTSAGFEIWLKFSGSEDTRAHFGGWCVQQTAVWGLAWLISLIVLARMRAGRFWTALGWTTMLFFLASTLACLASFMGFWRAAPGMWWYYLPSYARLAGLGPCLIVLAIAELADRLRGVPRDWLHGGGILAALTLGLIDLVMVGWLLLSA